MNYNFKQIKVIPNSNDLTNIILSKTQRKTPTVIHPSYAINRIRSFYMRKVKFTCENIHEKYTEILEGFPKLDDIHPFYADLINVIYDKDHYKIALGHVHTARNLTDSVAKDYVRFMKHGDSMYRCKMLKRAALGRMAKIIKRLGPSLGFLEEVRKHLARMPTIDPYTRTLLITGFPNAGKSSFINQITNANVEVQPYPFTTQSLFVGHTDHNYVRWQVIDSPGILDQPLDQLNNIEMQSITALAHLKACILYFIDISESCGYSIDQQISLYERIKALFTNKPVVLVFTKIDLKRFSDLDQEYQDKLSALIKENGVVSEELSNKTGEGILKVKETACNLLLDFRLQNKVDNVPSNVLKKEEEFLKGVYVALPRGQRQDRPAVIPDAILGGNPLKLDRPNLRQLQDTMGGAGVFNFPLQEHFMLEDPEWKYDVMPEIMDGKNVADFIDADIERKLMELEKEEEMLLLGRNITEMDAENPDEEELLRIQKGINVKKTELKIEHRLNRNKRAFSRNVELKDMEDVLNATGKSVSAVHEKFKKRTKPKPLTSTYKKQDNEMEQEDGVFGDRGDRDPATRRKIEKKLRTFSRSRSKGTKREMSVNDREVEHLRVKIQNREFKNLGKAGEADRHVPIKMPKHLFSGKRGNGKNDRR